MGGGGGGGGRSTTIRDKWEKTKETVRTTVEKAKDFLFGSSDRASRSTGREDSYDPEKAMLAETIRINDILTKFRVEIEGQCDQIEKDILKNCRTSLDLLIDDIKLINQKEYGGKKLGINLDRIIKENRQTEDLIHGYVKRKVQKRVSVDDKECLEILKMQSGIDKENRMKEFSRNVIKTATTELGDQIAENIRRQIDNICDNIQVRLDSVVGESEVMLYKFIEIERLKNIDEAGFNEEMTKIGYKVAVCDKIINEIRGA